METQATWSLPAKGPVEAQARADLIRQAYRAGLEHPSDWWAELAPLKPRERVIVREAVARTLAAQVG
jgi:hypothetical protein